MNLYRNESSNAKYDAQRNLSGRTHYVDDDTLRYHHSRVLSSHVVDNGLLFAITESRSLDMHNTRRGYRYVIFDVFGTSIDRKNLDECYTTSKAATKAMWEALNTIDAKAHTLKAIDDQARYHAQDMDRLRADVHKVETRKAA